MYELYIAFIPKTSTMEIQ